MVDGRRRRRPRPARADRLGHGGGLLFGALWLAAALSGRGASGCRFWGWAGAIGVGVTMARAWLVTYRIGRGRSTGIPVQSLSFTGPSADC